MENKNENENEVSDERDIETVMETLDSGDKDHKLGKPRLSASELLLKYKTKILEKDKDTQQ